MAVTVDRASLGTGNGGSTNACTLTTTAAVAAGAMIVVVAGRFNTTGSSTLSVAGGGLTWSVDDSVVSGNIRTMVAHAFAPSGLASGTVLTITNTIGGSDMIAGAASYLGVDTSGTVVAFNGAGASTAAWASGSIAANSGDAIVGGAFVDAGAVSSSSPTSPANERIDKNVAGQSETLTLVDKLSVSGSDSIAGTWNAAGSHVAVGVAYKAAAGGTTNVSGSDSAAATESGTVSATVSGSDSSAASEAGTVSATAASSDSAAATDTGVSSATVPGSDTGTGTEGGTASVTASGSDSATATEGQNLDTGATPISGSDSATVTDVGTVVDLTPPAPPTPPAQGGGPVDETSITGDFRALTGADSARAFEIAGISVLTRAPVTLPPLKVKLPPARPAPVEEAAPAELRLTRRQFAAGDGAVAVDAAVLQVVDPESEAELEAHILGRLGLSGP